MPYELKKVPGGYKVVTKATGAEHSKKVLSYQRAYAQMRAMYANEPAASK